MLGTRHGRRRPRSEACQYTVRRWAGSRLTERELPNRTVRNRRRPASARRR